MIGTTHRPWNKANKKMEKKNLKKILKISCFANPKAKIPKKDVNIPLNTLEPLQTINL